MNKKAFNNKIFQNLMIFRLIIKLNNNKYPLINNNIKIYK